MTRVLEYRPEVLVLAVVEHTRRDGGPCACGWFELGRSHAVHVTEAYEVLHDAALTFVDAHHAFRQGYVAGRVSRPVPLSENPYAKVYAHHTLGVEWRNGWLRAEADIDAANETRQFREPK